MKRPLENKNWENLRSALIGFGEKSISKSYYPELQRKLKELERFKTLLDHSHDGIFLFELDSFLLIDANNSALSQIGLSKFETIGKVFHETVKLSEVETIVSFFKEVNNPQNSLILNSDLENNLGEVFQVEVVLQKDKFESNNYGVLVIREIGEKLLVERSLRALAKDFVSLTGREFFNAVCRFLKELTKADNVFIGENLEPQEKVKFLGGAFEKNEPIYNLYPFSNFPCIKTFKKQMCLVKNCGKNFFPENDMFTEFDARSYFCAPITGKFNKKLGFLIILHSSSNKVFEIAEIIFNIFSDRIAAEIERIRVEKEFEESQRKYSQIFNSTSEAILIQDFPSWRIVEVNEAMLKLFILKNEDLRLIEVNDLFSANQNHEKFTSFKKKFEKHLNSTGIFHFEWEMVKKTGEKFWADISFKRIFLNKTDRILTVVRDISLRKKSEEKLIEAQKLDSIGNLAAGVAHDFNNMLSGIMGFASLLIEDEKNPEKISFLEGILESSKKAAELTQKLLGFGRRGKNISEPLNLNEIIDEVSNLFLRTVDKYEDIMLLKNLSADIPTIDADPSQISQVFMNLLVNAKESGRGTGVKIDISTSNVTKTNSWNSKLSEPIIEEFVEVVVRDNGNGIEKKNLKRVFEPFYTTKTEGDIKGTGLGLAMVYGIIKGHRGFIEIESTVGKGTIFRLYFPPGKKKLINKENFSKNVPGQGGNVLVVDDEELILKMACRMLKKLGFKTFVASNGLMALEVLEKENYDFEFILLDMKMPTMGGHETFIKIKEKCPDLKVLLSTGYGRNEEAQGILDLGVSGLLLKPYSLEQLSEKIDLILKK